MRWLCGWLACSVTACQQTDVVAIGRAQDACITADCKAAPSCAARSCSTATDQRQFCLESTQLVSVGDHCGTSPVFGFAVCTCTDFVTSAAFSVDGPASTAVAIDGELRVDRDVSLAASVRVGQTLHSSAGTVPMITNGLLEHAAKSCACQPSEVFDVAAEVAKHRTDNDNTPTLSGSDALASLSVARDLDLTCGRYYLSRIAGKGPLRLRVHGRVMLFVAGNIELDDALLVALDPGAQLAWFIADNVRVAGRLELSAPDGAASVHVVVGGSGTIDLGSEVTLVGSVYAPGAELVTRARFELNGALFVRRAAPGAAFIVHYDPATGDPAANGCSAP
jgi:hypothetical protein